MDRYQPNLDLLRKVPLFSDAAEERLQAILDSPHNRIVEHQAGDTIVAAHEPNDYLFIILDGAVDVRIRAIGGREVSVETLTSGDFFGEQALLSDTHDEGNATVVALQACHLFRISRDDSSFDAETSTPSPVPANAEGQFAPEQVRVLLERVRLFREFTDDDFDYVDRWAQVVRYQAGDIILKESASGDELFVVLAGVVEVFVAGENGAELVAARLDEGHYFGEQALLPGGVGRRNASVRAANNVTLARVSKQHFHLVLNRDPKLLAALRAVGDAQRSKIDRLKKNA